MSRQESLMISAVIKSRSMRKAIREGVTSEYFLNYKDEWEWLSQHKIIPSRSVFEAEFPDFRWRRVRTQDIDVIIKGLRDSYTKKRTADLLIQYSKKLNTEDPVKLVADLRSEVSGIVDINTGGGATELIETGPRYVKEFRRKQNANDEGKANGISTGVPFLDRETGGLLPSQLYIMMGRQSSGKTYLMLSMAAGALQDGHRVLWVSREMPDDMITYRLHTILSSRMRGSDNSFSNLALVLGRKDVDYNDYRKFVTKMRKEIQGKFFIPENRRLTINQLEAQIERHNPDVVFYDYIGIIGSGESKRGWQELGAQINHAKELAMHSKIPIVIATQVNRSAKDIDEAPMVENISFSDSIGYAADVAYGLQLSSIDRDNPNSDRFMEIWIRKNRYGRNDVNTMVRFDGDKGIMEEIDGPRELAFDDEDYTDE